MKFLNENPITSIIAVIVVVVGAVVTITNPETMSYDEYLVKTGAFLAGLGIVGVGRSLMNKG